MTTPTYSSARASVAAAGLAGAIAALGALSTPATTAAFSLNGSSLGVDQRDFRVWNNFTDASANDDATADAQFPGALGATKAIWKGAVEWGSALYGGTGAGDPIGGNLLGGAGANFDAHFQGETSGDGGLDGNVVSEGGPCGGGTLATVVGPTSDGWIIRFCPEVEWADGPGAIDADQFDLQAVMTRQYGHALGLGSSTSPGATMFPVIAGGQLSARSIEADDIAGLQAIYGVSSASKPTITGLSGDTTPGRLLTIHGANFSNNDNEVWFTDGAATGAALKVTGLFGLAGGTQLVVMVPTDAADGTVLVKRAGTGGATLSDAWPFDVGSAWRDEGCALAGALGAPLLEGSGSLEWNTSNVIDLSGAAPSAVAVLFVAPSSASVPFKGGTLKPFPFLPPTSLVTSPTGAIAISAVFPPGVPSGTEIWLQYAVADAGAPVGVALSNAIVGTTP